MFNVRNFNTNSLVIVSNVIHALDRLNTSWLLGMWSHEKSGAQGFVLLPCRLCGCQPGPFWMAPKNKRRLLRRKTAQERAVGDLSMKRDQLKGRLVGRQLDTTISIWPDGLWSWSRSSGSMGKVPHLQLYGDSKRAVSVVLLTWARKPMW